MSATTLHRSASIVRASGRWVLAIACMLALALVAIAVQPRDAWAGDSLADCGPNLSTQIGGEPPSLSIEKKSPTGSGFMYDWNETDKSNRPWASSLASIDSVVLGSGVANIGSFAFYDCSKLKIITIPKTVTSVGAYAFTNCVVLDAVVWDGTEAEWETFKKKCVKSAGNGFLLGPHVKLLKAAGRCSDNISWTLDFDGTLTVSPKTADNPASIPDGGGYDSGPWVALRDEIKAVVIEPGVTAVGSNSFCKMSKLASVTFPEGLKSIGYNAFYECTSLSSVTIPASVELLNGGFDNCSSLRAVKFLGADTLVGEYTFSDCSPDLVVTGFASETLGYGTTRSQAYYCHALHIPFAAVNGDLGFCMLDLSDGAEEVYVYPDLSEHGHKLEAVVTSIDTQASVVRDDWYGIDLDGNGSDDIRLHENEYSTFLTMSRAGTCSVEGTVDYELTDKQRIQASSGNRYGFYYSSVAIKLSTIVLDGCTVGAIKAQTYTGKALKPAVTMRYGAQTLKAGSDYTVAYANNVNAGTAKVTLTGKGACVGSKTVSFKINKAKPTAKAKKSTVKLKYAKLKKKAQVVANLAVTCDKGKASYKNASSGAAKKFKVNAKTGKLTVPKGTKKGTHKVKAKVTVKAGANYQKLSKTVAFKVKVA